MSKIGIITWHYYPNVGSMLQAFALWQYLSSNGHNVEFINYREYHRPKIAKLRAFLCKFDAVIPHQISNALNYHYPHFVQTYLPQSKPIYQASDLSKIATKYDVIICGSDQIWAPSVFNPVYMLSFVSGRTRKISYAASIGLPEIPNEKKDLYKKLLSDFHAISIREKDGAELLKQIGIESSTVCDPSFLLESSVYKRLISKNFRQSIPYVFAYFLGENIHHREIAKDIANRLGLQLIIYSAFNADKSFADIHVNFIGPQEFLSLIHDASHIITDSFHGISFSIIFRKNFHAVERFSKDDMLNQNSRVHNILHITRLDSRLIADSPKDLLPIDYQFVENPLYDLISRSRQFITDNI